MAALAHLLLALLLLRLILAAYALIAPDELYMACYALMRVTLRGADDGKSAHIVMLR